MNISKLDHSLIESNIYNHRIIFKKHKSNSISKVENNHPIVDIPYQQYDPKSHQQYHKNHHDSDVNNYKKYNENHDKNGIRSSVLQKISLNNDLQHFLSTQKKYDIMQDKHIKAKLGNVSNDQNIKTKYYLNNSFNSLHFNENPFKKSNSIDINSRRKPSITNTLINSMVINDIPSSKICINRSKGNIKSTINPYKVTFNNNDKVIEFKNGFPIQEKSFLDYKAFNRYKTSANSYSKFISNLKYPYCFLDFHDQTQSNKVNIVDDSLFEKSQNKIFAKWKEVYCICLIECYSNYEKDMRKKLKSKRRKDQIQVHFTNDDDENNYNEEDIQNFYSGDET